MIVTIAGSVEVVEPTDDELSGLSIGLAAFDGEVGNGTFPFNDAFNELTVATGRQLMVEEGATLLSDGFMLDQDRTRTTEPQGRLYGFGILDANALLDGFRIRRSRPAETDVARVLAFAALDGPSWDTSMVLVAETVTMPAKRYDSDGGWTSELIPDVVSYTGKTLFLHDLADGSGRCLHYHNLISGHACGLSISDDSADRVTVWEPWEPTRNRTSVDLRNDVKGTDQVGRTSTVTDPTSIAAHDADGLEHQSLTDFEAASQTDLDVQTAAFLASQKNDLDTWSCQIGPLDEAALALIRVGDIIEVTSAVMGLTASDQRIAHMTLTPALGESGTAVPDVWMAQLEMGAPIRRRRRKPPKALIDRVEHKPIIVEVDSCQMLSFDDGTITEQLNGTECDSDIVTTGLLVTVTPTNDSGDSGSSNAIRYELSTPVPYDGSDEIDIRGRFFWPLISDGVLDGPFGSGGGTVEIAFGVVLLDTGFAFADLNGRVGAGSGFGGGFDPTPYSTTDLVSDTGTWAGTTGWWLYHIHVDASNVSANLWPDLSPEPGGYALGPTPHGGGSNLTDIAFLASMIQAAVSSGGVPEPTPPPLMDDQYIFTFDEPQICSNGDEPLPPDPLAFHALPYGPVYIATADGSTSTFTLPDYPPDPIASVRAFINGNYEPSTYDPTTREFTFADEPTDGDIIDAEIVTL